MFRSCLLAVGLVTAAAPATRPLQEAAAPACDTVAACIAALRADVASRRQVGEPVRLRLAELGEPAADALVALLTDASPMVRESAGLALTYFGRIDPRHLPTLVRAWREGDAGGSRPGNGWLPRPIAATGTDEALRLLWADFERDPETGSNAQVFFALAWHLPEQTRPLLLARIAACRGSADGAPCAGIYALLAEFRPPFPDWSIAPILDLAEQARSDDVRASAEATLAFRSHPAALAPLQRRLAALPPEVRREYWSVRRLIGQIAQYGAAARASGPAIIPYLGAAHGEHLRADAALALGRIDARAAVPALLALAPDLADDWLLAYNVAESLGRLRAAEARPLLERLAAGYWHRGVRHNAARALNMISGGAFTDPASAGDGAAYPAPRGPDGVEYMYFGHLRFAGDDAADSCDPQGERRFAQDPVAVLRPRGGAVTELTLVPVAAAARAAFRRQIPHAVARGEVQFALPVDEGTLVGFNGGEFGGGLVLLPDEGTPRTLTGEPMAFAWRTGNRLFLAAGLAHLMLDTGHVYVVDPVRLRIERTIRLPASPQRLYAAPDGTAIVDTEAGQVAVGADGQLVDVERVRGCMDG